jgi:hypothetical protein
MADPTQTIPSGPRDTTDDPVAQLLISDAFRNEMSAEDVEHDMHDTAARGLVRSLHEYGFRIVKEAVTDA